MQSTAFAIDRSKGSGKAHSKGKAKILPMLPSNDTAQGNYNRGIFSGKGKAKATREFQVNDKVNDPKGKGKGSIPPTKGKDNANGKNTRDFHSNFDVNVLKGKSRGGVLSSTGKGEGKATESAALNATVFRKSRQTGVHSANGPSKFGERLGRNGPRTAMCPAGGKVTGNAKRKRRKNPKSKSRPNESSSAVCVICQENLNGACDRLDCMHAFHVVCASQCVANIRRAGCPICRAPAPLWLSGKDSIDVMTSPSESEVASSSGDGGLPWYYHYDVEQLSEQEDITDSEGILGLLSQPVHEPAHSRVFSVSDFDDDLVDGYLHSLREIDQLRDEFPDLDSDALENLYEERLQDFDESGSYYSHGS